MEEESDRSSDSPPQISPYAGMEPELAQDSLLAESARRFRELQAEIERSFDTTLGILERDIVYIAGGLHSKLSAGDVHDLNAEIDRVNRNIWDARAKLDSYIKFTNSTPRFELTLNLIYQLYNGLRAWRKRRFYRIHAMLGNFYYEYFELTEAIWKLKSLFSGHEGVIGVGADYIEKPPPTSQAAAGAGSPEQHLGSPYYPHTPWNPSYEQPWRYSPYEQEREAKRRRPREIGDSEDSLW